MDQNGDNVMSEKNKTAHGEETYSNYFSTPFYATTIDSWTDKLNKTCQPWLDDAHNTYKKEAPERKSDFSEKSTIKSEIIPNEKKYSTQTGFCDI